MLEKIQNCFKLEKALYTKHAKDEMERDGFGAIKEEEVFEAILNGKVIESYMEDEPYPSSLIYGNTHANRPLHIVCAYAKDVDKAIVITVYQPDSERWVDFERRRV